VSIYDSVTTTILRRCDDLFPIRHYNALVDWKAVSRMMEAIPLDGERFMTSDEILRLYE